MPQQSSRVEHQDIRIGTIVRVPDGVDYVKQILPHGFECFQAFMWQHIGNADLPEYAKGVLDVIGDQAIISSIGMFGNPLQDEQTARDWETCIKSAKHFRCSLVCGFAGAQEDRSVPENMPKFKEVFGHLAKVAADEGVRIAFENCDMGGDWHRPKWNIAHAPRAWEMIFNEVPGDVLGLEWEPCHQMNSLIDPLPQLRKWVHKVYHLHGKDATISWDVIREQGLRGGQTVVHHRTPGFGDTNWTDVISILRSAGYRGCIDIEGWHDPVYRDDLEMTGQVYGLNYLKQCRGGAFIPNPK
ncbi:MAG TPA: sugar phosphate isomerase/epimerase family protein [Chthonomonadaceae bacterium]|nr:sugar phosphate isomerase/epimerase family protein [Chthonomonadaceae bacterium]